MLESTRCVDSGARCPMAGCWFGWVGIALAWKQAARRSFSFAGWLGCTCRECGGQGAVEARTGLTSSTFAGRAACIGHPLGCDALGAGVGRAECIGHPLGGLEAAMGSCTSARMPPSESQGG